jgi:hypothetical protein
VRLWQGGPIFRLTERGHFSLVAAAQSTLDSDIIAHNTKNESELLDFIREMHRHVGVTQNVADLACPLLHLPGQLVESMPGTGGRQRQRCCLARASKDAGVTQGRVNPKAVPAVTAGRG